MKKRLHFVGGLGNQLFLIALGIYYSDRGGIEFDITTGKPRLNESNEPSVFAFRHNFDFSIVKEPKFARVQEKLFKFGLIISSKRFTQKTFSYIFLNCKMLFEKLFRILLSDGVGFDPRLVKTKAKVIIAPAHTYYFGFEDRVYKVLRSMTLKEEPNWLAELKINAQESRPIILHIRLTDYSGISELGILNSDYYAKCLSDATTLFPESPIWLFSDDPDSAIRLIDNDALKKIVVIDKEVANAAAHLEAMRMGAVYILSNSTFSWWGAFLSYEENPVVFCPNSWFKTKDNPMMLLPETWNKVSFN